MAFECDNEQRKLSHSDKTASPTSEQNVEQARPAEVYQDTRQNPCIIKARFSTSRCDESCSVVKMEKFEGVQRGQQSTRKSKSLGIRFLAAPLLAFLVLYNLVPAVHDSVQSFFSLEGWNIEQVPVAETAQGTFVGKVLDSNTHPVPIEAFLGIRYAEAPVGELRFAKPVPLANTNETIQAAEYSLRYAQTR